MSFRFLLEESQLPENFEYPQDYLDYISKDIPEMEPWRFLWSAEAENLPSGLKKRYPERCLVPFARRIDNDDVACFDASDKSSNPRVVIIHDFASPGWEKRGEANNFLDWLELVKHDMEDWE